MQHEVKASMSGTVWKVLVQEGDDVSEGQEVVLMESMKMTVPHTAPAAGKVTQIKKQPDAFVDGGEVLLVIEGS